MAAQSTDPIDCALIQPKSEIVYEYAAAMALRPIDATKDFNFIISTPDSGVGSSPPKWV